MKRDETIRKGVYRLVVHVYIFNVQEEMLMQQR